MYHWRCFLDVVTGLGVLGPRTLTFKLDLPSPKFLESCILPRGDRGDSFLFSFFLLILPSASGDGDRIFCILALLLLILSQSSFPLLGLSTSFADFLLRLLAGGREPLDDEDDEEELLSSVSSSLLLLLDPELLEMLPLSLLLLLLLLSLNDTYKI